MDSRPEIDISGPFNKLGIEEDLKETPSANKHNGEDSLDSSQIDQEARHNAVQKYEDEWQQLRRDARDVDDLGELRRRALLGSLRASRFRSVSWRLLLRLLPPDPEAWPMVLKDQREHYTRLITFHNVNPSSPISGEDNPLSQDTQSCWNQYFCNKELQAVIRQDVVRTFPGIDFFRERSVQDKMVSILFCYARTNPDMCYRQGMHEILAPVLFVLHSDHQALMHSREQAPVSKEIIKVVDPQHMEADAYTLFSRIMAGIENCYRVNDLTPLSTGHFPQQPSPRQQESLQELNQIRERLLVPKDPQLAYHLHRLDIPLTLFGIRWLRLLFGREFPLQDLLVLWDAIFAESEGGDCFELVDYVVVAMLIAIRHQLLTGDYTTCLTYLMRYPGAVDITYIIEHSLHLKDPEKYCQPAVVSFPNLPVITIGGRPDMNRGPVLVHKPVQKQESSDQRESSKQNNKKGDGPISRRIGKLSGGRWGKQQSLAVAQGTDEQAIVEGYTLDDPALTGVHLHKTIQVVRSSQAQLLNHLSTLRSLTVGAEPAISQALDGIQQACSALGSVLSAPLEVEPALEAGELARTPLRAASSSPLASSLPPADSLIKLKVYSTKEGQTDQVVGAPLSDPLNRHAHS